jgi:TRAP-type C4-dicarboxylate transport system permease small subunit
MLAGWLSAFRHRAYLGWLGLAFLTLSGSILAHDKVKVAQELGAAAPQLRLAAQALLVVCAVCFVLAVVMAVQESIRRLRELRERHEAAEEALLAMVQASREKEARAQTEEGDAGSALDEEDG